MYAPSLECGSHAAALSSPSVLTRERSGGVARCHNHRATSGDAIAEIHASIDRDGRRANKGEIIARV